MTIRAYCQTLSQNSSCFNGKFRQQRQSQWQLNHL
jgi:hypothetical protein